MSKKEIDIGKEKIKVEDKKDKLVIDMANLKQSMKDEQETFTNTYNENIIELNNIISELKNMEDRLEYLTELENE